MSLITRCPKCVTAFSVGADQLRAFEGLVRCGQCKNVFDGYSNLDAPLPTLTETVSPNSTSIPSYFASISASPANMPQVTPQSTLQITPQSSSQITPQSRPQFTQQFSPPPSREAGSSTPPHFASVSPALPPQVMRSRQSDMQIQSSQPAVESFNSSLEPTLTVMGESRMRGNMPSDVGRDIPGFMATGPTPSGVASVLWRLGVLLALIGIALQTVYVYRNDLAASAPILRPWLARACQTVGCDVQFPKHAERISIQASTLQQNTRLQEGDDVSTFKLRFTLQNRFDKPQAWPHLLVLLTDASGAVVVRKVVPPADYVPRQLIDTAFMSQQEANFVVDLQVKGLTISGFEIDKFFP